MCGAETWTVKQRGKCKIQARDTVLVRMP